MGSDVSSVEYADVFSDISTKMNFSTLPQIAIDVARTDLFDTLACAIGGVTAAGVDDLRTLVLSWGGTPEATVWGTGKKVPAHHAALINGMMSHARDYDDTHDQAVLHAGVSIVPAAVAAAERCGDATGEDLISGIAAGLELMCRLGVATTVSIIESGYMYSSLYGHFAATAAAARVMRLDRDQTINALGIAYSQAAGNHQVTRDAALTKRIQPGFAAKTALISTAMSKIGIRGAQKTFQGPDGLFRTYLHDRYDPEVLTSGLGTRFEFTNLSFKPYPCCRFTHPGIDGAAQIRQKLGGDVSSIRRIRIGVSRQSYEAVCTPPEVRKNPQTVVQAQFSLPYTVACALVKGGVGLADMTEEGIRNQTVLDLAAKVECYLDEQIERDFGRRVSPVLLIVETDTETFKLQIDRPRGDAEAPMTVEDFDRKLVDCLRISGLNWGPDAASRLRSAVESLDANSGVDTLIRALTPNLG